MSMTGRDSTSRSSDAPGSLRIGARPRPCMSSASCACGTPDRHNDAGGYDTRLAIAGRPTLSAPIAARTRRTRLAFGCFVPPDGADADGRTGCQHDVFRLAVASGLFVHGRSGGRRAGGVPKTSLRRSQRGPDVSPGYRVPVWAFRPSQNQMFSERLIRERHGVGGNGASRWLGFWKVSMGA